MRQLIAPIMLAEQAMPRLAAMYEAYPSVCLSGDEIARFFMERRIEHADACAGFGKMATCEAMARQTGIRASEWQRTATQPERVSMTFLQQMANALGYDVAVVFYEKQKRSGV